MMDGHSIMKHKPIKPSSTPSSINKGSSTPKFNKNKVQSIQDQIAELESSHESTSYISNDIFAEPNFYNTAASSLFEEVVPITGEYTASATGIGPMIIRVRPDGTLVDRKMPVDEDLIHYKMAKTKIPPKNMLDTFVNTLRPSKTMISESQPYAVYVSPNH